MYESPVVRLIEPPFERDSDLARELDGLHVVIDTGLLSWSLLPGNEDIVFVRNFEIYHALAVKYGPERANELTRYLTPRQATAFPMRCCAHDVRTTLSKLGRGNFYL